VVRIPGEKKVAVDSYDDRIDDPIETCVGMKGLAYMESYD
jgi:transcription antitermination factor NusA-like protein